MNTQTDPSDSLLRQRKSIDLFVSAVIISFLLHIAGAFFLLLPGRFSAPASSVLFVDLQNMTSAPAPDENPVKEQPLPDDSPPPQSRPLPEAAPEAAPETARLDKAIESSLRRAVQAPDTIHESSIGLGMVSGHFSSFAEGESLKDEIRVYYFSLMRRINEVWWLSGATKGSFVSSASVNLHISREGKIVACNLLESSGNREQDQALLDAVRKAEPLPPLPSGFPGRIFTAPIRFVPPLRLMFPGFTKKTSSPH